MVITAISAAHGYPGHPAQQKPSTKIRSQRRPTHSLILTNNDVRSAQQSCKLVHEMMLGPVAIALQRQLKALGIPDVRRGFSTNVLTQALVAKGVHGTGEHVDEASGKDDSSAKGLDHQEEIGLPVHQR